MPCANVICSAATISYLVQHHLILRSASFLFTRPLEAYGSQLPPRCFTLRVQHLALGSASYSDATVRLQSFEALAVSHSLHSKNGILFPVLLCGVFSPHAMYVVLASLIFPLDGDIHDH